MGAPNATPAEVAQVWPVMYAVEVRGHPGLAVLVGVRLTAHGPAQREEAAREPVGEEQPEEQDEHHAHHVAPRHELSVRQQPP